MIRKIRKICKTHQFWRLLTLNLSNMQLKIKVKIKVKNYYSTYSIIQFTEWKNYDHSKKLGTLRPEVKDYKYKAIIAAGKSNTPITEIIELGKSWVDEYSGYTLGSDTDIVNAFANPVLTTLIERISLILCGGDVLINTVWHLMELLPLQRQRQL